MLSIIDSAVFFSVGTNCELSLLKVLQQVMSFINATSAVHGLVSVTPLNKDFGRL